LSKAKRRLSGDLVFLRLIRPGPLANNIATYLLIGFSGLFRSATNVNAITYGSDKLFDIIEISIIDYNKAITYLKEEKG
jgi:hypothetical protein